MSSNEDDGYIRNGSSFTRWLYGLAGIQTTSRSSEPSHDGDENRR